MIAAGAFALLAAACFAFCSVLQHRATGEIEVSGTSLAPTLVLRLLRRPLFLVATVAEIVGLALQTLALGLGSVSLVQPLLVTGLLIAVPLGAAVDHRHLTGAELGGAALTVVGLAVFLLAARPGEGVATVDLGKALPVVVALLVVIVISTWRAQRSPARRGVLLGLASGALYGISVALIKVVAHAFGSQGLGVVAHWPFWAMLAFGGTGMVLNQHAFAAGAMGAPLAMVTLAEPVAAVSVGTIVLSEQLASGAVAVIIQVVSALTAAGGVWLLCSSPGAYWVHALLPPVTPPAPPGAH